MADANGIMEKIKIAAVDAQEAKKPVNVYFGEVISKSPLQINVEQKMLLGEKQLVLAKNVTDYVTMAEVDWETEEGVRMPDGNEAADPLHNHRIAGQKQIMIYNGLEIGDLVILIRQQEGQKFIVADRIGGTL